MGDLVQGTGSLFMRNWRFRADRPTVRSDLPTFRSFDGARSTDSLPSIGIIRRMTTHLSFLIRPERKVEPTWAESFSAIVRASWLNPLLIFLPASWSLHYVWNNPSKNQEMTIFVVSFLAILPLAKLMGLVTEQLSIRVGRALCSLINATFGNGVDLIIAIIALRKCQLAIVQSSLVGSMLSHLLLALGMSFFAAGIRYSESRTSLASVVHLNSSFRTLSVTAVLLPSVFHCALRDRIRDNEPGLPTTGQQGINILKLSRGVSVILVFIYCASLAFQFGSHPHLYTAQFECREYQRKLRRDSENQLSRQEETSDSAENAEYTEDSKYIPPTTEGPDPVLDIAVEEVKKLELNIGSTLSLLIVVTVLVAFTADFLVGSISGVTRSLSVSQEWVGLILLPLVANAAKHTTAAFPINLGYVEEVTYTTHQISFLVLPLLVLVAWMTGRPLSLLFDPLEAVTLFLSVLTLNYTVAYDGKSNWFKGLALISLYVTVAVVFYFYEPDKVKLVEALGLACASVPHASKAQL